VLRVLLLLARVGVELQHVAAGGGRGGHVLLRVEGGDGGERVVVGGHERVGLRVQLAVVGAHLGHVVHRLHRVLHLGVCGRFGREHRSGVAGGLWLAGRFRTLALGAALSCCLIFWRNLKADQKWIVRGARGLSACWERKVDIWLGPLNTRNRT